MDNSAAPFGTYWVTLVNERTGRVYKRHVIAETAARAARAMHEETGHSVIDVTEPAPALAAAVEAGREAARNAPPISEDQKRRLRGALLAEPTRPVGGAR